MAEDARNALPAWDPQSNSARVVNDPAELEREFRAGRLSLVNDHRYPVVGPDGKVGTVAASAVPEALQHGWRFASAEDFARADAQTVSGQLRSVADGALDAATLGFGDALQAQAGVDKLGLQARATENPGLRMLGMAGGAVGSALLTGGTSLGGLAEVGAARVLGPEAAATTLGRMAATGVGGAVEGAAFGVGDHVSEAVLGDTPLAAESLIASGIHGAMWGGVTGVVLGRALGRQPQLAKLKPTAEEINAAAAKQLGDAPPKEYGQRLLDFMDSHAVKNLEAAGADPELVRALSGTAAERRRFLELAQTPRGELDAKVRELKGALEAKIADHAGVQESLVLERATNAAKVAKAGVQAEVKGAALADAQFVNPGLANQANGAAEAGLELANARVQALRSKVPAGDIAAADRRVADLEEQLARAPGGDPRYVSPEVTANRAQLEADIQLARESRAAMGGAEQDQLNVVDARISKLEEDAALKRAKLDNPKFASDPALKAAAAEADATLAAAKAERTKFQADNQAVEELRRHFGVDANGSVDEGKLGSFVDQLTRPRADERMQALRNFAADDPKLTGILDDLGNRQAARNLVRDQVAREGGTGAGEELFATGAGALAYSAGGFPAAVAAREVSRAAAGAVNRPLQTTIARYRLAAQVQRVHGYVRDGLDRFVTGAQGAGRAIELDRKLAPMTQLMLSGSREERRTAVAARVAELSASDPAGLADSLEAATAHTTNDAPDVSAAVRDRLAKATELLRSVVPQALATQGAGGGLLPKSNSAMIPDRDIRRFAAVDAMVQDPLRLIDQLSKHVAPDPAAVTAFQTAYPALWGHVVQQLYQSLADHPDAVGWAQARSLALTLDVTSHPSFAPANLNLQQALTKPHALAPARPGPVSRSLGKARDSALSGATATLNDHLMDRPARR